MTTAKAKYIGEGDEEPIPNFSENLKQSLRKFYPDKNAEVDSLWGHPADAFVEAVLSEAWWAKSTLHWQRFGITKAEVRAEQTDLLKVLRECENKLRHLSPGFFRILGVDADPLGCADLISLMIESTTTAAQAVDRMSKTRKPIEKQHDVVVELSVLVLRVLKKYGIRPAATGDCYFGYTSVAVKVLKLIGDDLGLVRDELTWRDAIIKAKEVAPDLQ